MRNPRIAILAAALTLAAATAAPAAMGPLKLAVTKSEHKDYKTKKSVSEGGEVATTRNQEISATVIYTIEASNLTGQPLGNVQFYWAVLVNRPGRPLRVVKGDRSCDLKPLEKYRFEAGPIELRTSSTKIDGYYVEASVDGNVVASDIQPANTKERVDALARKH